MGRTGGGRPPRRASAARPGRPARDGREGREGRAERRKTHGQNFIRNDGLAAELVAQAGVTGDDLVVEVGAGAGVITEQLVQHARRVVALELDPEWAERLRARFAEQAGVEVVHGDVLRFAWPRSPFRVLGNIPFGITTPLLNALLDNLALPLTRADLIVQHEVARKRATPGPSTVLGLSWEPWFTFAVTRRIPATAFSPVPAVDAAFMAIERRADPLLDPRERRAWGRFVRTGFARGGILRAGLRSQLTNNQVRMLRGTVPFDDTTRCSALGVHAWVALYEQAKPFLS